MSVEYAHTDKRDGTLELGVYDDDSIYVSIIRGPREEQRESLALDSGAFELVEAFQGYEAAKILAGSRNQRRIKEIDLEIAALKREREELEELEEG